MTAAVDRPAARLATRADLGALAPILLIAFNLQTGIFAVGPLLAGLTADLGLSGTAAGALAAIPPLMMGLVALPGGRLADRWGPARTIALGMAVVAVAGGMRGLAPGWPALAALTMLFGVGTGVMQPATTAFIRERFPDRIGGVTGWFTFFWVIGIICASGLTGTAIAPALGGWRGGFAFWGVSAGIAAALWMALMRPWRERGSGTAARPAAAVAWSPWRDRQTWLCTGLYAGQGIVFFLLALWLPAVYAAAGLGGSAAAVRLTLLNASCLPASIFVPSLARRIGSLRTSLVLCAAVTLLGTAGFAAAPVLPPLDLLWPALVGAASCGVLVLVLTRIAVQTPAGHTGNAAGMAMSVGYVLTAAGPFLAGVLSEATGGFRAAMLVAPATALLMVLFAAALSPERSDGARPA